MHVDVARQAIREHLQQLFPVRRLVAIGTTGDLPMHIMASSAVDLPMFCLADLPFPIDIAVTGRARRGVVLPRESDL